MLKCTWVMDLSKACDTLATCACVHTAFTPLQMVYRDCPSGLPSSSIANEPVAGCRFVVTPAAAGAAADVAPVPFPSPTSAVHYLSLTPVLSLEAGPDIGLHSCKYLLLLFRYLLHPTFVNTKLAFERRTVFVVQKPLLPSSSVHQHQVVPTR